GTSLFEVLTETPAPRASDAVPASRGASAARPAPAPRLVPGRFVQVLRTFIATATPEGLLLFDQHALHERVLYRHLREAWRAHALPRQELLQPLRVELPASDVLALEEHAELLESVGVRVAPFGRTAVAVSSLPALAGTVDVDQLIA